MAPFRTTVALCLAFATNSTLPHVVHAADQSMVAADKAIIKRQYKQAADLLLESARTGNSNAQYRLGVLFRLGLGVGQSDTTAAEWLKRASENGSKKALLILSKLKSPAITTAGDGSKDAPALRGLSSYVPPVDANERNAAGLTWLMRAAGRGKVQEAAKMLLPTSRLDDKASDGDTAMLFAARGGNAETISALLAAGAGKNVPNGNGQTPLMMAALSGDENSVKALLDAGSDVSAKDNTGSTALMLASRQCKATSVAALLSSNVAHAADARGQTPLVAAVKSCENAGLIAQLIPVNDVNMADLSNRSALWYAARNGDIKSVVLLLDASAAFDNPDKSGKTPLLIAAENGHGDVVKALIDKGQASRVSARMAMTLRCWQSTRTVPSASPCCYPKGKKLTKRTIMARQRLP